MSVVLSPSSQLTFSELRDPRILAARPEVLVIHNAGSAPVAFKVKTTAPDQYSVRPNAGKVEPNSQLTLQVYLQPVQSDIKERYKDRFLIQTVEMTPDEVKALDMTEMWQRIEAEEKERMNMFRLKCVFNAPPPPGAHQDPTENKAITKSTGVMPEKEGPPPLMMMGKTGTETTPPASPKPSNNDNASSSSSSSAMVLHETVLIHEENERRMSAEVLKTQALVAQLQEELARSEARLEDAERRCEQYKTSLVDKYGARHVQMLIEQQEHEHPILVVWVAVALTFMVLRAVI